MIFLCFLHSSNYLESVFSELSPWMFCKIKSIIIYNLNKYWKINTGKQFLIYIFTRLKLNRNNGVAITTSTPEFKVYNFYIISRKYIQ